jgi:RNA polymerase sigma-B factor
MPSAATTTHRHTSHASGNTRGFSNIDQDPASRIALERFAATRDPRLRDELIRRYDRVVQWVVNRQAREPGQIDDLLQVGRIALLQALERYQPERGVRFTSYAIKIISGTLKHYYRDRVAMIRVPRPLQDLAAELPRMQDNLTNKLGRLPSETEIAEAAGVPTSEVCEALRVGEALKPQSLDERSDERSLAETVGGADQDIEALVEFAPLHTAIDRLEERQQYIVRRRYFDLWSQSRVASSLGISQMHVSRLERDGLRRLRTYLANETHAGHGMAN